MVQYSSSDEISFDLERHSPHLNLTQQKTILKSTLTAFGNNVFKSIYVD